LAALCPNLELLHVGGLDNVFSNAGVLDLLKGCRKLQSLDVTGESFVDPMRLMAQLSSSETSPSLRVLKVSPSPWREHDFERCKAQVRLLRPELHVYDIFYEVMR